MKNFKTWSFSRVLLQSIIFSTKHCSRFTFCDLYHVPFVIFYIADRVKVPSVGIFNKKHQNI